MVEQSSRVNIEAGDTFAQPVWTQCVANIAYAAPQVVGIHSRVDTSTGHVGDDVSKIHLYSSCIRSNTRNALTAVVHLVLRWSRRLY